MKSSGALTELASCTPPEHMVHYPGPISVEQNPHVHV